MATSVAEVVGTGARALRIDAGLTLEEVARAAQLYGLPWTSGRVGDFEAGRVAPTLPTLIAAAAALGKAVGRPVAISELISGSGQVQINDQLSIDKKAMRAVLSDAEPFVIPLSDATLQRTLELLAKTASTAHWPKRLRAVKQDLRIEVLRNFSESDARMCKNIGVDLDLGAAAMAALWRRSFTAERNQRAGPGSNAQRRGQISRQLKTELQAVINNGND